MCSSSPPKPRPAPRQPPPALDESSQLLIGEKRKTAPKAQRGGTSALLIGLNAPPKSGLNVPSE